MFQSNQAYVQLNSVSGGALDGLGWLVGLILTGVVFAVIIGGIKSIARVTEKIVPFMAVFYCLFAIIVILMNAHTIPLGLSVRNSGARGA
jgi:AGCS family alanine or glycine:cation symporter